MKLYKFLLAAVVTASMAGCDDDFDRPPVILPEATIKANTKIIDVKTKYWQNDKNYATQIGNNDQDEHTIISGRVISNGESGNVYKSLIIQDETAALSFSINSSKLSESYAIGQEVVIDLTDLNIGKYNGLQQVGQPQAYQQGYEVSFMELDLFQEHAQFNGLPEPNEAQPVTTTIADLTSSTASDHLCKWQSQLVKLENVRWEEAGQPFSASDKSTNRYLVDENGKKMLVRNSNYASFASDIIPAGTGTVVAIASYYGNDWQLLLRSLDDLTGFEGTPDNPNPGPTPGDDKGTADSPYTVQDIQQGASGTGVWVTGYIAGYIPDKIFDEGVFKAEGAVNTNILLSSVPNPTSVSECIPVALVGSLRNDLGLGNHPENLGKEVTILGNTAAYFGQKGLKETSAYNWGKKGGETPQTPDTPQGDGQFKKVENLTSGKDYVFVIGTQVGTTIAQNLSYGRLALAEATFNGDMLTTALSNEIKITAVSGGYVLIDSYGRYLSMDDSHLTSFQLYNSQQPGSVWTFADGIFTNALNTECRIGQDKGTEGTRYPNIAPSKSTDLVYPMIYEKI